MSTTIEYVLEDEDIVNFNLYHHRHSKASRRTRTIARWAVFALFVAIGAVLFVVATARWNLTLGIAFTAGGFVCAAIYNGVYYATLRKQVTKLLSEDSNAGMTGRQVVTVTGNTVTVTTDHGTTEYAPGFTTRMVQTDRYLYYYISSIMAIVIPTSVFSSDEAATQFKDAMAAFLRP